MNLRTLKRFLSVAELGSINKAALHLNVSQPSLSKDVRELEERLGVELFKRSPQGVSLTAIGDTIFLRAKLIDAELGRIDIDIRSLREVSMGEVHVGVVPGFLQTEILPTATLNLTRQAQRLTVNYRFGNRTSLLQPLLHGDLDFLIVGIEEDEYASQLVTEPLVQDRNALVVRAGHPILAQPGQRPLGSQAMASALAHHPWLVLSECIPLENMLRQVLRSRGVQFANSVIRTDSFYFFRTSLLASDCIGLTRYDAARLAQKAGHVVELPLASMKGLQLGGSHMIGIVHRREHALSAASKALIKEIRQLTHAAGAAPKSGPTI